nr:NAD(P)H-dependent oxidoreductase [Candidatus Sigynarchaeota archaeon]
MKILVILAHPNEKSFNHAIASTCVQTLKRLNHDVKFHDLYKEDFDPLLPSNEIPRESTLPKGIQNYCNELVNADGIVIVHPNWWGQPPAILKGWIDRIFRPGIAYKFEEGDSGEGIPRGLLKIKVALIFNTSNTRDDRELNVFKDPLDTIWKNCIFQLCGVTNVHRKTYNVIVTSTPLQRQAWLDDAAKIVTHQVGQIHNNS